MLLDPSFFQMDSACIGYWHSVVDNLMTHDKTTFKDLMCKIFSYVNIFFFVFVCIGRTDKLSI